MQAFIATLWRAFAPGTPHFVRDYNRFVLAQRLRKGRERGLTDAVGGAFEFLGVEERKLLLRHGLRDGMSLVDIGCGSGRLANALRDMPIRYTGTDVVPALLDFARDVCRREDWRFEPVVRLTIPVDAESADFVTFFSVFTHLHHTDSYRYLMEARRALKPGGTIVFSFLDFTIEGHWPIFEERTQFRGLRAKLDPIVYIFMDKASLPVWARHLELDLVAIEDAAIGQSVCVLRKPTMGAVG